MTEAFSKITKHRLVKSLFKSGYLKVGVFHSFLLFVSGNCFMGAPLLLE